MHNIDIAALLREALRESGCDESLLNNFDGHSTIELECTDMPSVLLSNNDGDIWLWAKLCEESTSLIAQKGGELLALLMEPCAFSTTDQLQLMALEGVIMLKGLVKPEHLYDGAAFAAALEEFFEQLNKFIEVLR